MIKISRKRDISSLKEGTCSDETQARQFAVQPRKHDVQGARLQNVNTLGQKFR